MSKRYFLILSPAFFAISFIAFSLLVNTQLSYATIKPYDGNKFYWQYNGSPVLLLGGSKDDNLFQIPDLEAHLNEMEAVGANYIRNTMSDRKDLGFEIYSFHQLSNGKYDLDQWNNAYWTRFENLLRWTRDRNIIVQIEVWDRFDYASHRWDASPWNPKNNINYTSSQSGLATTYAHSYTYSGQPFFSTVPALDNNKTLLPYQQKFVDKMLSISLNYPNVLYVMDNETEASPEWGKYWSLRIKAAAAAQGKTVYTSEMWFNTDITAPIHKNTLDHPELYSFADVSQNNAFGNWSSRPGTGETHWLHFQSVRNSLTSRPWPINNVKIYGADTNPAANTHVALERFWRNLIGGAASNRFHRPKGGLGLSSDAKNSISAARKLETMVKMWEVTPSNSLLSNRATNEAYLAAEPGEKYVLYFTNEGSVGLNLSGHSGSYMLRWINIQTGNWESENTISGGGIVTITAPSSGHWVAAIVRVNLLPPRLQ